MGKTIREMPENIRPYEKCRRYGTDALDDAELLAVILRTGTRDVNAVELAQRVLKAGNGSLSGLNRLSEKELMTVPGIGEVRALMLKCLLALSVRITRSGYAAFPDMSSPEKIAGCFMEELRHETREQVRTLYLNSRNRLISEKIISRGGADSAAVPVREILAEAFRKDACGIVLLHNHPSGDPSPSHEDILVTEQLLRAAATVGIPLVDHIIIGDLRYLSFKERGYIS